MSTSPFGGARPKERVSKSLRETREMEGRPLGLDPGFVSRHSVADGSDVYRQDILTHACDQRGVCGSLLPRNNSPGCDNRRSIFLVTPDTARYCRPARHAFDDRPTNSEHNHRDKTALLLECLQETMSKTIKLIASTHSTERPKSPLKTNLVPCKQEKEGRTEQPPLSLQQSKQPLCSHYHRRCLVCFSCCGIFYPCHKCHNESKDCTEDKATSQSATRAKCTICFHEQAIDEGSQWCGGCNSKMSDYFCAICKQFNSNDKNPYHCAKCRTCRINGDKAFHCDVCDMCLDKLLGTNHGCRPNSRHEECGICFEDTFSGCVVLPCSHRFHRECVSAMVQNGVRKCPKCRSSIVR